MLLVMTLLIFRAGSSCPCRSLQHVVTEKLVSTRTGESKMTIVLTRLIIMGSVPPASPQKPEVKGGALARRAGQAACSSWKIPEVEHAKPGTPTPKTTERKPS